MFFFLFLIKSPSIQQHFCLKKAYSSLKARLDWVVRKSFAITDFQKSEAVPGTHLSKGCQFFHIWNSEDPSERTSFPSLLPKLEVHR